MSNDLEKLINSITINAPLVTSDNKSYKYPYKPALIIAIIKTIDDPLLIFNNPIKFTKDSPIIKMYFDLLMNSETLYRELNNQSSKEKWFLSFNDEVKKSVISNIFNNPAKKIDAPNIWIVDNKNKTITISINKPINKLEDIKNLLLSVSINQLKKCVPDYKDLSEKEIIDYKEYLIGLSIIDKDDKQSRRYQHIFAKAINERDKKCLLCNLEISSALEAAHIKPHRLCENNIERLDVNNGILLCRNHHIMFDRHLFSFYDNWEIFYSKSIDNDLKQKIKETIDIDYIKNFKEFSNVNTYLEFYNKQVFEK